MPAAVVSYVTVMTPVASAIAMVLTYFVRMKPTAQAVAAAVMPVMSSDSKPSETAVLAEAARFRPSVTFERTV